MVNKPISNDGESDIPPKPAPPCRICGSNDWWYRESSRWGSGEWLCGRCIGNPNKEEVVIYKDNITIIKSIMEVEKMPQQNMKLVDGKFVMEEVVSEKKVEKETIERKPLEPKQYSEEALALRDRAIKGNQKLFDAWQRICGMDHESQEWRDAFEEWHQASRRLLDLSDNLKSKGYEDCLYINIDNNKKRSKKCIGNADGFFCLACPSNKSYWETDAADSIFDKK